jgi:cell wall-associated NlpC family hydrolase
VRLARVWPDLNAAARKYLGTPYVWGGETKRGIDCSGFTKRSYYEGAKVSIPRNSRQQWKTGQRVDYDKLQEGDLVFFNTMGTGVSHVGLLVDSQSAKFIHASSSRGVVEDDLGKQWFRKRYLGARRVLKE